MKKRFLTFILSIAAVVSCAFGFSACEQPHEHEYTEETTTEATCEEKGVKTYTCACADTYTEEIPALGHDEETHEAKAPTCTEIGWEEYVTCKREGCGYTTYEEIPATGVHTWDDGKITTEPTCTQDGVKTFTCTVCETATYTEAIPALSHDEKTHEAKAPTCTEIGWEEYVTCEREGCEYTTYVEIPATGVHTWDKGEETKAPTCTEEGETTYTCTVCKTTTKTEPVNKLPHEHAEKWTSNATHHWHECKCGDKDGEEKHVAGAPATATTPQICTVCGYVLQEETGILFNTLTVEGTSVYGVVSNATTDFSFIDEVTVKGNATYIVDDNKDCNTPIKSKTVDLESGDNTFYVLETIGNDIKLFTVTIRRRPMYDVTFDVNGGTAVAAQKVEEGYLATEPITTKVGYTFAGWDYDFIEPITENTKITASWSANKDTKYTVNYYLQNLDDSNYTLHETVELKGETDTTATAEIKEYTHFTYNANKSVISGNINGDGSRVLSVYYTRDSYKIVANNNNEKAGTSTSVNSTYKYDKEFTLTATTNAGYTWLGWYDGETLACAIEEFTFKAEKDVTYTATWSANADTKYIVNYYLQNLDDNNYTLYETVELQGETDTTATADIKEYTHFTYNANKSVISGNINGDSGQVLSVYYTRDTYSIVANNNNVKAGASTQINGTYKYDKEFTLTATTNAGYTWLGWYDGETLACETEEFTFKAEKNVTYTATWSVNTDTKYTVNYYLQNLDDSNYTLHESVELEGETDTMAYAETERYEHFTYNASLGAVSGNINGDGGLVLSVYYTRNTYTLSVNNAYIGNITNVGTYRYGSQEVITEIDEVSLGYEFIGWYSGEELLSTDDTYTFTVDKNVTAKFVLKEEMSNFTFTSTATTCEITGIMDKTVTEIIVPDYVKSIERGAFRGCDRLESITIPFVGKHKNATRYEGVFGYIFGYTTETSQKEISGATFQFVSGASYYYYYIPTSLREVIITSAEKIGERAFYNCSKLTSISIPACLTKIEAEAFGACWNLASVHITDIEAWCKILFGDTDANPLGYAGNLYLNNELITEIVIPDTVKIINNYLFYNCDSLTSVVIGDSVTWIGNQAFADCDNLTSVVIGDSVTTIGEKAFQMCENLTSVVIGSSVISIASRAFQSCSSLADVVIPDSVTKIGEYAFGGCSSLESITIPFVGAKAGVTANDTYQYPFGYIFGTGSYTGGTATKQYYYGSSTSSTTNTTYYIPTSLKSVTVTGGDILYGAFYNCDSLTSVVIGDSVTTIGSSAFGGCSSLESITIPFVGAKAGVTASDTYQYPFGYIFGTSSYTGGTGVKQYYYGSNTSSTTSTTYYIPTSLKSVTVTGGNILYGAFYYCSSLTSIEISDSVTSIGSYAFYSCESLTSVVIPDSVTSIGDFAFYYCRSLTSVEIPDSVTLIGSYAFDSCYNLMDVVIPDSVTSIGNYAFACCESLTSVVIGDSVTSIGSYAFYYCSSLTSVVIGDSVTSIGDGAFEDCYSLTRITFSDTSTWYRTESSDYTGGTKTSVTNSSTNATYFKSTYYDNYWYKL